MAATLPRRMLVVRGPARRRAVYLTFDDGPHPDHTPRLLDALSKENIRATFFVVGQAAEKHPDLVRRIVNEGHELGHHTYFHKAPETVTAAELVDEIRRTALLLEGLTRRRARLFRPPHGRLTIAKCARLWAAGQTIVLWNVDPRDFRCHDAIELRSWFREHALSAGDVVLLHDNRPYAAEVIAYLAAHARLGGLEFARLSCAHAGH